MDRSCAICFLASKYSVMSQMIQSKAEQKRISELFGFTNRLVNLTSELFELHNRLCNLSWTHHLEVSSLKTIEEDEEGLLYLSTEPDMTEVIKHTVMLS